MKTTSVAILMAVACSACATDEDDKGAVNPSDVAFIGTGLAVVSSAGVDEVFDDNNDDDNSSFNSSFNSSNPNSTFNSSTSNGTDPWDLDCEATIIVSGALNETLSDVSGCGGGSVGSSQALTWIWGLETQYQLRLEDAPVRVASDTSDFTTEVLFRPFELGSDEPSTGWITTCAISIDSSEGYTDGFGGQNAIWTGTATCPDPAIAVEESDGGDFMAVDGDPISIESFSFTTPYPTAL